MRPRRGWQARRRPIKRLAILALLGTGLAGCNGQGLNQLASGEQGRVAEVRSGDTLVLDDGLVVRLAEIDAPNLDQPYAAEATAALSKLVSGQTVQLLYAGRRRDNYGRALAQVRLKDSRAWLQMRLLQDGAARVRTYADNRALAAELLDAEAEARGAKKGIWALADYRVRLPVEARGESGFELVEGRVSGAFGSRQGAELDLDKMVTAKIPQGQLAAFAKSGRDPGRLTGKLVRVRGYLRRDGTMALDHPEQLEPLRERP